ncbi:ABC transporter ATP-binding protein/permease [Halobacteria archaeon AArc-m2/3/4]|uniref:ABC transporter ATP-binding protein/permease n=1 Tax=Natronoglomus mannanivorans TaxID=2979990 RepID=A0AAP2Z1M8_9EURY|nr:ABC transporter ATP-binding protein/permease [Halobacteria archaeon AArc-xg1-1]MCU4974884.1 ABC transporter ATP-binding protein/permease [Halobacteria archaeon AArc-m2/3/4]
MIDEEPTRREKLRALWRVITYRPRHGAVILLLGMFAALFEGIGVGFLVPIIETAQSGDAISEEASGMVGYFVRAYQLLGLELDLAMLIAGLAAVMTVRYGANFLLAWIQASLGHQYLYELRQQSYEGLLAADVSFVDEQDGDEIMNAIVTETQQAAHVITLLLEIVQKCFFIVAYLAVALILSPALTIVSVVILGTIAFLSRFVLRSGYEIGDRVALANETIQSQVNAGIRGLREVKLFNMTADLTSEYRRAHEDLVRTRVKLQRNQAALQNFNQLFNALVVFALIYVALQFLSLSFTALGVFLFAMFRLSPLISGLNNSLYTLDGLLPHLARTQQLIDELDSHAEPDGGEDAPSPVTELTLEDVTFHYDGDDGVTDITARVERGETIALVGPSGAGKSTIISLMARLYDPDEGEVRANGVSLEEIDLESWHDRVTIVRQDPFMFNDTLRYNVTVGNPNATRAEIECACEVSQVSAFVDELPDGLDTRLGDDGVRLSGGQRQRVAIARALLKDADVLLLDEATSELDSPTEEAIVSGIDAMDREYATVVIGHWLSTVRGADRLYTIVDGDLVEAGTHRELLDNDGHYADLYASQVESTTTP